MLGGLKVVLGKTSSSFVDHTGVIHHSMKIVDLLFS